MRHARALVGGASQYCTPICFLADFGLGLMQIYVTGGTRMDIGKVFVDDDVGVCGRLVWPGL
jgi:hypothetical protein